MGCTHHPLPRYAEAFSTLPGQCFRFVSSAVPGRQGMPHHCPLPVALRGTFVDGRGVRHWVSSCMEHGDTLEDDWERVYPVSAVNREGLISGSEPRWDTEENRD